MDRFGRRNVVVELSTQLLPTDDEDNDALADLAHDLGLPVVATTGAHYAAPGVEPGGRGDGGGPRPAQPGRGRPVPAARPGGAPAVGRGDGRVVRPVPDGGADRRARSAEECSFDLHLVAPKLPPYDVPPGHDENSHLRQLTMTGAARQIRPTGEPAGCLCSRSKKN